METEKQKMMAEAAKTEEKVLSEEDTYAVLCQNVCPRSFFLFKLDNPVRKVTLKIVKSKAFDRFILCMILFNCLFLAMDSNKPDFEDTSLGKFLATMELVFTVIFVIEFALKVVALGSFIGANTYWRDSWNCLDGTVVLLGLFALASGASIPGISGIRTVRVLRPLRTVTGVEGMRVLVVTLLKSLPMLVDVLILVSFAFFIFGIAGLQIFSEQMRNHCNTPALGELRFGNVSYYSQIEGWTCDTDTQVCYPPFSVLDAMGDDGFVISSDDEEESLCSGPKGGDYPDFSEDGEGRRCGLLDVEAEDGETYSVRQWCKKGENPNFDITRFDNILWAWLTIFQCITMEGWTDVMYFAQDATSNWAWLYFVLMIIFGSFFAVNLALAVLYVKFTEETDLGEEKAEEEAANEDKEENKEAEQLAAVTHPNALVQLCYNIQRQQWFDLLTMGLIIFNTLTMCIEYYRMPEAMEDALMYINFVLSAYFGVEMIIKIIGLGPKGYCADRMNVFDGAVVLFSFLEIGLTRGKGGGSLSVLRSFRLLRVFKLARSWKELNQIITTIFKSLASISYLSLILLLFIFIFALLGMKFFGYKFEFCEGDAYTTCPEGEQDRCPSHRDCYVECEVAQVGEWIEDTGLCVAYPVEQTEKTDYLVRVGPSDVPRHNFDNIFWSFITIFQILTGENWNEVMYDAIRSVGTAASLYFILLNVLGNYVVLNLFLAILLDNFGSAGDEAEEEAEAAAAEEAAAGGDSDSKTEEAEGDSLKKPTVNTFIEGSSEAGAEGTDAEESISLNASAMQGNSLFLLSPTNPLRQFLAGIVCNKHFEYTVIVLIIVSSLVLALDAPGLDADSDKKKVLDAIDKVFVVLFTIEMSLKVVVMGFVGHPGSYLRSPWNMLDFTVVVFAIIDWAEVGSDGLSALRALRTFRALRPIRMASRAEGMKVIVNALFQAFPGIVNVSFVCFLFYVVFGILFLNLFNGQFYFCKDQDSGDMLDADTLFDPYLAPLQEPSPLQVTPEITKTWCEQHTIDVYYYPPSLRPNQTIHTTWQNPEDYNFDNIGSAILALFEMATLEGWLPPMYSGIDAAGDEKQPVRDHNPPMALVFVLFIVVGSFFVLNLFVGVTIDKFNEMKEKQEGKSVFLTPEQEQWVNIQKLMLSTAPLQNYLPPTEEWRLMIFEVVSSTSFDIFIMANILLNVLFMSMTHADMSQSWEDALFWANTLFALIFTVEAVLKLIAFNPRQYFDDSWNRFDFAVVLLSIAGAFLTKLSSSNVPGLSLLRIFRVSRVFRLIPKAKGLRTLFNTLITSLPALGNVGSVLFLFYFIFAIMGMNLFGKVKYGDFLDRHANFQTFPSALMVLFRMSTGESWNGIMHDTMVYKDCWLVTKEGAMYEGEDIYDQYFSEGDKQLDGLEEDDGKENQCGPDPYGIAALLYFISFIVICAFVLLNLVIGVILENFESCSQQEEAPVGREHMQSFQDVWSILDPRGTEYIPANKLFQVIGNLEHPFGVRGKPDFSKADIQNIIMSIDIPNHNGRVHFYETVHALAGRVAGIDVPEEEEMKIRGKIREKLPVFADAASIPKYTAAHYHAALYVQAAVRGFLARYHMRETETKDGQPIQN
ncbi:Caveolin-2 [Cymbomonas tetramitiformis]|uniref:Caveolin-2 n=1 Tax=Cymbomonas tetramitiformis TaxID=36881 RepID=A0AAE0F3S6_9CHLO|nr:Caveolin-2 [Cymbomonas tetramitiformis]|eukprot:gene1245-1823_t